MHHARYRAPLILAILVLLLPVLYVGAYFALVKPAQIPFAISANGSGHVGHRFPRPRSRSSQESIAMNCFETVLAHQGLTDQAHTDAMFYALLKVAAFDVEGADTDSNKVRACVARLDAAGIGAIALSIVKQNLNSLENRCDTRR